MTRTLNLKPSTLNYSAESVRFELTRQLLVDSLANCSINHSGNSPYCNELANILRLQMYVFRYISANLFMLF